MRPTRPNYAPICQNRHQSDDSAGISTDPVAWMVAGASQGRSLCPSRWGTSKVLHRFYGQIRFETTQARCSRYQTATIAQCELPESMTS